MAQGNNKPVIKIKRLSLRFGGLQALHDVNLEVRDGEILAIIGPNGAGKTCLLNCINGFYHPYEGEIFYQEKDLTRLKPHRIAELGIARTFQNIELFSGLTALENLMSARHIHMKRGAFLGCLFFGPSRREEIAHRGEIEEIIDLLEMETIRKKIVGSLPYGQRKKVKLHVKYTKRLYEADQIDVNLLSSSVCFLYDREMLMLQRPFLRDCLIWNLIITVLKSSTVFCREFLQHYGTGESAKKPTAIYPKNILCY